MVIVEMNSIKQHTVHKIDYTFPEKCNITRQLLISQYLGVPVLTSQS